jgi:hypothetical protein
MKQSKRTENIRRVLGLATSLVLAFVGYNLAQAYELYTDGCNDCHGSFRDATTTKGTVFPGGKNHDMHRATGSTTNMNTGCNLCHIGSSKTPVYTWKSTGTNSISGLGCSGCHLGPGLRKHHIINGVGGAYDCYGCHNSNEVADPENVIPPYYGTWDTRVKNPGNTVLAARTNENWSVGDFLGLDNDGNNLYDMADYAVGPADRILSSTREGNNIRITWQTVGGRTNRVQAASRASGTYSNLSPLITSTSVGLITTNYVDAGGATNKIRFHRLQSLVP